MIKFLKRFFSSPPLQEFCHENTCQPVYQTDYWKSKAEADERADAREDEWLNLQYRHEIDRAARDKLFWFIENPYNIYIGFPSKAVHVISRNHEQVFGKKTFNELVNERYLELRSEEFTDEALAQHKEWKLREFCNHDDQLFEFYKIALSK